MNCQNSENQNKSNNDYIFFLKKEKNTKKTALIITISLTAVIILVSTLIYVLSIISPKYAFEKGINAVFDKAITANEQAHDNESVNLSFDAIKDLGMSLDISSNIDRQNKIANVSLNTIYNNQDLLNLKAYVQDENVYIDLGKLYNKLITLPVADYDSIFESSNNENVKTLIKELKNEISKSLENKYFEKANKKITVNGKEITVTENTLVLNAKNSKEIALTILKNIKNNDKMIKALEYVYDMTEKEIKEYIEQAINEINNQDVTSKDEIRISLYTKGILKEYVGLFITDGKDSKEYISVIKDTTDTFKIAVNIDNTKIDATIKETKENNKYTYDIKVVSEPNEVSFKIAYNIDYDNKVTKIEVKNSIDYTEMDEEDYNAIINNLSETPLYSLLSTY